MEDVEAIRRFEADAEIEVQFYKRDTLIWKTWGLFPNLAFEAGMMMQQPSGRNVKFVPASTTKSPALKPVRSEGYAEWVRTYNGTEMIVTVRKLTPDEAKAPKEE